MGEEEELEFEFTFNRSIKVESREERLTGDAGVMLLRELDERLGLTSSLGASLDDHREQDQIRYSLTELLRQRIYGFVQGYRHQDDGDRTAHDPAMRLAVWEGGGERALEERLSSQPTLSRLLDALAEKGNLEKMRKALSEWQERFTVASGKGRKLARGLLEGESGSGWDAARVRDTLLKTGGRILKHSRRLILAVAQAVTPLWNLFQRALRRLRVHNPGPTSKRRRGWNPPPAHAHLCLVLRQ